MQNVMFLCILLLLKVLQLIVSINLKPEVYCFVSKQINIVYILCFVGVPEVPKFVSVRERSKGSAMEVTWKAVVLNNSAPVLYIVQSRFSIGYHYSEQHATPWKQISQVCNRLEITQYNLCS